MRRQSVRFEDALHRTQLGRIGRIAFGLAARCDLLDVFEPEQHLIFGQRLRAAAEAFERTHICIGGDRTAWLGI